MINTLYRLDWSKILPEVQSGLLDGRMRVINGVARRTSDMNQIVQHLPFVPVEMQTSGDLLSRAKAASGLAGVSTVPTAALALSTAVVLGAVIVSTAYLAGKIAEVQLGIAKLEKAMQGHTLIFYIERALVIGKPSEAGRALAMLRNEVKMIIDAEENQLLLKHSV